MLNTVEVNGFYADTFNQYNLQVGKAESVCPLCSHQRKPENKKKKCASLDWERGLGTCHNCNKTFQLHTYLRKGGSDIEYKRPEFYESGQRKVQEAAEIYKLFYETENFDPNQYFITKTL